MTHKQSTQPILCQYAISKEYINTVSADTNLESPHFPIYLQIKDKYFKAQLEYDLYLPVLYHKFQTKAPLEHINQHNIQHLKNNRLLLENYLIIQHTDVTLKTKKTEPFTH